MIADLSTLSVAATWVARASCSATAVAAVILLAQWTLRNRLSAGMRYALWLVLVVRLALPISPQSRWSVFNVARVVPARLGNPPAPWKRVEASVSSPALSLEQRSGVVVVPSRVTPLSSTPNGLRPELATREAFGSDRRGSAPPASLVVTEPRGHDGMSSVFKWIWLAGVVCFATRLFGQNLAFSRRLRSARLLNDPALVQLLDGVAREIGLRRAPALFETEAVNSPALYGVWRPRLLLPMGLAGSLTTAEVRFVFLHELAHLKRWDLMVNWVMASLQVLHWFNPAVWFAFARMRADREQACDALALARAGQGEHRAYGETLLKILSGVSQPVAAPGLVGIAEDLRQLKARMRMIASYPSRPAKSVGPLLLLGVLAVVTLTDAQTDQPPAGVPTPIPSPEPAKAAPLAESTLAQDGRLLLEMGKLDEAEAKLQQALRRQPDDKSAAYYLRLVQEARSAREARKREISVVPLGEVDNSRSVPYNPRKVPAPGSTTVTNLSQTSRARTLIRQRLERIVLESVRYDALPLSEVVRDLVEQARRNDPDKVGLNIILNPTLTAIEPNGDANLPPSGKTSLNDVIIRLSLKQVRLVDALDAVCKVAETPIQYSIEDYAVVFVQRTDDSQRLFTRTYRVDPHTFLEGLRALYGEPADSVGSSTGQIDISKEQVGPIGDLPDGHIGMSGQTTPTKASSSTIALVRRFFAAAGVDFASSAITVDANGRPHASGKALFFHDRNGLLLVRATMAELDIIEKAVQVANCAPPQITITTRLIEFPASNEAKPLGFDWFVDNDPASSGGVNQVVSPTNNAGGVFPGSPLAQAAASQPAGLRPATGVITDKQAQAVLRAIERGGVGKTVANPTVTTVSGRPIRTEIPGAGFSLDVVPNAMADGYTISLNVNFTLGTGPGAGGKSAPLRTSTSAMVWDGQTMLLGPFPSGEGEAEKRVLLLVTPTLIDPAGNRVHAGE